MLPNHKSIVIGIMLPIALIASSRPGLTITAPKQLELQYQFRRELDEKYTNIFNRLLGQCRDWRPSPRNQKINTICKNLVQKMNLAGTELIKQGQLIEKIRAENEPPRSSRVQEIPGPPEAPARPHRKRVAVPMDAATLKKNQARIEKEIKLRNFLQGMQDNALGRLLGSCGQSRNPAIPKPIESVCEELTQKFETAGSVMLKQGDLVKNLVDELPVAARKGFPPGCEGFYLPSGTFITLPDCPPGKIP
jgi:hypothetical protein